MRRLKTKSKVLLASVLALGLAGATALIVTTATADDPPSDLLGETAQVDAQGESVDANAEGDVLKPEGEPAELLDAETGEVVFTLDITEIEATQSCPGRTDEQITPELGNFVVFKIDAWMSEDITEFADNDGETFLPLLAESFEVTNDSGDEVYGTGSDASFLCFEPDELVPSFVGPGESASGLMVIDSSVDSGFLRYSPDGQAGWTWEF